MKRFLAQTPLEGLWELGACFRPFSGQGSEAQVRQFDLRPLARLASSWIPLYFLKDTPPPLEARLQG